MENSKSLVVAKKGILQKVQEFFRKIFKKQNIITNETEEINTEKTIEKTRIEENFINDLKKNTNSDIKELIYKIQSGEVCLDDKNDAELAEIEQKLTNYLNFLDQEINTKKEEIERLEIAISSTKVN